MIGLLEKELEPRGKRGSKVVANHMGPKMGPKSFAALRGLSRLLPRVVHVGGGTGEDSEGTTSHPEKKMTEEGVCTALLQ